MHEEIILIGKASAEINEIGDPVRESNKKIVYGEEKQIYSKDFFQAAASNMRLEICLVIWKYDYKGQKFLEYNNLKYKIVKTYTTDDNKIELTCTSAAKEEIKAYGNA